MQDGKEALKVLHYLWDDKGKQPLLRTCANTALRIQYQSHAVRLYVICHYSSDCYHKVNFNTRAGCCTPPCNLGLYTSDMKAFVKLAPILTCPV